LDGTNSTPLLLLLFLLLFKKHITLTRNKDDREIKICNYYINIIKHPFFISFPSLSPTQIRRLSKIEIWKIIHYYYKVAIRKPLEIKCKDN